MKLATFDAGNGARLGLVTNDKLLDLTASGAPELMSMLALIDAGEAGLDRAQNAAKTAPQYAVSDVRLLAPLPEPRQIRDASSFPRHIANAPNGMHRLGAVLAGEPDPGFAEGEVTEVYRRQPIFYITNRFSVLGHDADVIWPGYSDYMDYELEVAAVIGKRGSNIDRAEALNHVFGYTIFNDFSARDTQLREMAGWLGPAKGKSFDGGNVFGPVIVTRDEIPDPHNLRTVARINGRVVTDTSTAPILHGFDEMIAFISQDETLHPGEIIGSGTVNDGCGLERFEFLEDGDVVELEVEGIGILRNRVQRSSRNKT